MAALSRGEDPTEGVWVRHPDFTDILGRFKADQRYRGHWKLVIYEREPGSTKAKPVGTRRWYASIGNPDAYEWAIRVLGKMREERGTPAPTAKPVPKPQAPSGSERPWSPYKLVTPDELRRQEGLDVQMTVGARWVSTTLSGRGALGGRQNVVAKIGLKRAGDGPLYLGIAKSSGAWSTSELGTKRPQDQPWLWYVVDVTDMYLDLLRRTGRVASADRSARPGSYVVYRYLNIGDGEWQNSGLFSGSGAKAERARLRKRARQAGYEIEVRVIPVDGTHKDELKKLRLAQAKASAARVASRWAAYRGDSGKR
jgi:hypothetical protein